MAYKIKVLSEDFIVKEVSERKFLKEKDLFLVIRVEKEGYNTDEIAKRIASILKTKRKNVTYAGNKDRRAITSQFMSIKGVDKKNLKLINIPRVKIFFEGYLKEPIALGDLLENEFVITIRNLSVGEKIVEKSFIPNYFGSQRFGLNNHVVGKFLVKKDFKKACLEIIKQDGFQKGLVSSELKKQENNFVGALRRIPKKLLMLFVHAYQSEIFNKMLRKFIDEMIKLRFKELTIDDSDVEDFILGEHKISDSLYYDLELSVLKDLFEENIQLPLIGFDTTNPKNEFLSRIYEDLLKDEDITSRDFLIRSLSEISPEGADRRAVIKIKNLDVKSLCSDDLNRGKFKCVVSFSLEKGSYATNVIENIISRK